MQTFLAIIGVAAIAKIIIESASTALKEVKQDKKLVDSLHLQLYDERIKNFNLEQKIKELKEIQIPNL